MFFSADSILEMKDLLVEGCLFGLIFCGEHIEVSFGNASANAVFVQFCKQGVEFFVSLFSSLEFIVLPLCFGVFPPFDKRRYMGCEFGFVALGEGRPVLQAGKNVGVEDIVAYIVHGALMRPLRVFSTPIVAIGFVALRFGAISKGASAIRAFY